MAMVGGDSGTMLVGGWPAVDGAVVGFNAADSARVDGNGNDAVSGDCADMRRIVAVQVLKVHARCQVTVCCLCFELRDRGKMSAGSDGLNLGTPRYDNDAPASDLRLRPRGCLRCLRCRALSLQLP